MMRMVHGLRRVGFAVLVLWFVVLGMVAQAGSHLLALTTSSATPVGDTVALSRFSEAGPFPVGTRNLPEEPDSARLTIWYPAAPIDEPDGVTYAYGVRLLGPDIETALATYAGRAVVGAPFDDAVHPLVVLSHGFALTPGTYGWLAEHLASHGMLVVAPDHAETLDPGGLWKATIERPRQMRAVLDDLDARAATGGDLHGLIDMSTVAVVGHSYGGYAALAAGGAELDLAGFSHGCTEARVAVDPITFLCDALEPHGAEIESAVTPLDLGVDAVVSISGDAAMFGVVGLAALTAPVMVIGGTADTDTPYAWGPALTFEHAGSARKVEVALEGAGHLVFAGRCETIRRLLTLADLGFCTDPAWDRDAAQAVVKHHVAAFLSSVLLADPQATATLGGEHLEIGGVEYDAEGF